MMFIEFNEKLKNIELVRDFYRDFVNNRFCIIAQYSKGDKEIMEFDSEVKRDICWANDFAPLFQRVKRWKRYDAPRGLQDDLV
jgi:hypothetical protein